jgi:hypothetical protein
MPRHFFPEGRPRRGLSNPQQKFSYEPRTFSALIIERPQSAALLLLAATRQRRVDGNFSLQTNLFNSTAATLSLTIYPLSS